MQLTKDGRPVESPVCLIKDHVGPCNHKWCMMANKAPHYFGIGVEEYHNRRTFIEFDVHYSTIGGPSQLVPHKPDGANSDFEMFRQAENAAVHLGGEWPKGLKTVPRDHVEIRFAEYESSYPSEYLVTFTTEWLPCLDVQQFAFYLGPLMADQKGGDNE